MQLPDECEWVVWVDPAPPARVGIALEDLHATLEASWIKSHKLENQAVDVAKRNLAQTKELKERKEMMRVWTMFFPIVTICMLAIAMLVCAQNAH